MGTVRDWLSGRLPAHSRVLASGAPATPRCAVCGQPCHPYGGLPTEYLYLLGLYLGDGTISAHAQNVFRLRVFLDLRYPGIIDDCRHAMELVMPGNRVHQLDRRSNFGRCDEPSHAEISCFSKSWPCLFPQHGAGKKHERRIVLTDWQQELVDKWPGHLLRGLIHSDGCRFINSGRGDWSCPRYAFSNKSSDIRAIFSYACDQFGVEWTRSGDHVIYVSRNVDVARLDEWIGPKA
jgi:hypothetical protein